MCCIRKTSSSPFHFSQVFSVLSVFTQFSQFSNPISEMLQVPLFPLLPTCVSLRVPGPPPTSVVLVPEYIEYIEYTEYTAHFHVPMWNASNPGTSFLRSNQFPFFSWSLRAFSAGRDCSAPWVYQEKLPSFGKKKKTKNQKILFLKM